MQWIHPLHANLCETLPCASSSSGRHDSNAFGCALSLPQAASLDRTGTRLTQMQHVRKDPQLPVCLLPLVIPISSILGQTTPSCL